MIGLGNYDIVVSPVVTEKSTFLSENNQVVFNVKRDASKPELKVAVEALFNVEVLAVNTLIRKGKSKRVRSLPVMHKRVKSNHNLYILRKNIKRVVVTLAKGYSIDVSTGL